MVNILVCFNIPTHLPFQILPIDGRCYYLAEFFVPIISWPFCCFLGGQGAQIPCYKVSYDVISFLHRNNLVLHPLLLPYSNCQNEVHAIQTQWHLKRIGFCPTNVSYRAYATVRLLVLPGDGENQVRENFGTEIYLNSSFLQDCFSSRT